jgi:hypothetical protein
MSALDIGPAILGLGQMVGETSRILYGDQTRVRVEVKADFEHASFGIEFFAVANPADLTPPLTLEQLAAIATVLGFMGATVFKGLIGLLKWQRGRKVDKVERVGDEIRIEIEGDSNTVTVNEYKVFVDPEIRKALKAVVSPLSRDEVDKLSIQADSHPPSEIAKVEREQVMSARFRIRRFRLTVTRLSWR